MFLQRIALNTLEKAANSLKQMQTFKLAATEMLQLKSASSHGNVWDRLTNSIIQCVKTFETTIMFEIGLHIKLYGEKTFDTAITFETPLQI